MAHATDGGGSIRIPAVAVRPVRAEAVARPGQPGADRRDPGRRGRAALRVDLGARQRGAARRDGGRRAGRSLSRAAVRLVPRATQRAPGRLRVAFMRKPVGGGPLDPVLVAAVERTAKLLEELGHHVEEAAPDYDAAALGAAFGAVMCANTWTNIQLRAAGRVPGPDDLEPVTRLYAETGRAVTAPTSTSAASRPSTAPAASSAPSSRSTTCCCRPPSRARSLPLGTVRMDGTLEQFEQAVAPMIAVHRGVQRHRRAGHVGAARMDRRRPADRHALRRPLRRRGDAVLARGPARAAPRRGGTAGHSGGTA